MTNFTGTDLDKITGITNGTAIASKAVITDTNVDVTGLRNVTATGSFIIGSADINETDLEKLDGITNGTAIASKCVVTDSNVDITGLRNITATGTLGVTGQVTASSGLTVGLDFSYSGHKNSQTFMVNCFQFPSTGTTAWNSTITGVYLAPSLPAKKCWLPLNFLKIGDEIVSYKLVGDITAASAPTLDCKIVSVNKANPLTTTDITGGGIVQATADGNFDVLATLSSVEIVATDKQYTLEILGTTDVGDEIWVIGVEVLINRK